MKRFLVSALLALCCALPSLSWAQASYVRIEERLTREQLQSVGLTPAQLERLNQLLRESQERAPAVAPVAAATASVAAPRGDTTNVAVATSERGDAAHPSDRSSLIGFNDEPIRSRLKGSVSEWSPGTVFELENGQQWKVLKGRLKLPRTLDAPEIVVVPGIAGRWFLQVDEGMPKARVYRID